MKLNTDEGWLYAAIIKDLCLRKIVVYAFSSHIDTNLTVAVLEMAIKRQKPQTDLIFHSDRGVQYASCQYRKALAKHNIVQSMSRKGDPYDNAVAENFFSCLKCELVHHKLRATYHGYSPEKFLAEHIDYCFINESVKPVNQKIIDDVVDGMFPSDHYGLYIELEL